MSGEVLVTFGEIANGQASVNSTQRNINQQLDDLKAFLAPLVAAWSGAAAEDYNAKQALWDRSAADLNTVLAQIGVALGTANDNYRQAESTNQNRWV